MQRAEPQRPAVALVGPTASGKTEVGILLAEGLGTEIIGVDSRQVYRRLDIGTAKPTAAERRRVPHHLVDCVEPDVHYDAGRFRDDAERVISGLEASNKLPLFIGGTGLYLKAIHEGICPAPPAVEHLRSWLKGTASDAGGLHQLLMRVDPGAAGRIHPNDTQRLTRALEVYFLTGERLSERQARHRLRRSPLRATVFGLRRESGDLKERIRRRVEGMTEAGFAGEVAALLADGLSPSLPSLGAVGYPQMIAHLEGKCTLDAAAVETVRATWQYARRQMTWFRGIESIVWVDVPPGRGPDAVAGEILDSLQRRDGTMGSAPES